MNRDKVEQEAMRLLQRGQTQKALERYISLLREDPRDRRLRQRVGELYLQVGRKPEAIRYLSDVARSLRSDGQVRAASSIYRQLVQLRGDDLDLLEGLGACLREVGRRSEARKVFEQALTIAEGRDAAKAVAYAQAIARLSPGETPPRVRVAELLERAGRDDEAARVWTSLANEARRRGRADDRARFLERGLKLDDQDFELLLSAAEARLANGEPRVALGHLQRAYTKAPKDARLLTLLGRSLQALGQDEKARKVWIQAARLHDEAGDAVAHLDALRHAQECAPQDDRIRAEFERASAELERRQIRLDEQGWARPKTDDEVRVLIRAATQRRYGFPDRARQTLEGASDAVKAGLAWKVHYGELLVSLDQVPEGAAVLRQLRAPDEAAAEQLRTRLGVLGEEVPEEDALLEGDDEPDLGDEDALDEAMAIEPDEDALLDQMVDDLVGDDEDLVDDDTATGAQAVVTPPAEPAAQESAAEKPAAEKPAPAAPPAGDAEAEGDALLAAGDRDGALAAWRRALASQPTNIELLRKIGEVMSGGGGASPSGATEREIPLAMPVDDEPDVDFGGAFAEIDPDEVDSLDDRVSEARAMVEAGLWDEALSTLRGEEDLEAVVVAAMASARSGSLDSARTRLERGIQAGSEHHPAYVDACFDLAGVYLRKHKLGNAERMLDEVERLDPTYRPRDMAARRRALELLRAR